MGWTHGAFEIPDAVYDGWRTVGERGAQARAAWAQRHAKSSSRAQFDAQLSGDTPKAALDALDAHIAKLMTDKPALATRAASGKAIESFWDKIPGLTGGSADLTGSVNTLVKGQSPLSAGNYAGQYIHYGVREHGMAAAMNGMTLHGGVRPYAGTFLVFSDYCRPAVRLSALMNQPVIYVFTHDSIGLGEDGPTHQPVEHLSALRAIPNLAVFRPADAVEAAEAWRMALERRDGPTCLILSRQKTPHLRTGDGSKNLSARGAYVLSEADGTAQVTLIGTGTETALALEAQCLLKERGVDARVVSAPSVETFLAQDKGYRDSVVDPALPAVAVEAGIRWGWDALIGRAGGFVGMTGFGASAPAEALYDHFAITAQAVAAEALKRV